MGEEACYYNAGSIPANVTASQCASFFFEISIDLVEIENPHLHALVR